MEDEQAAFDLLIKALSETDDWDEVKRSRRKYKELDREHSGLTQLMFETERRHQGKIVRRQFRILGILIRTAREFIFLGGCEKHGEWTVPHGAFDEALRLRGKYEQNKGTTREHAII